MTGTPGGARLGDLARVHREPLARSRRARTVLLTSLVGLAVVPVAVVVVLVVAGDPGWWSWSPLVLTGLQPLLLLRGVELDEHGLRRRQGVVRLRRVPWEDVAAVEPPGRWRDHGVARLSDGRVVELRGMTPHDVDRLASALAEDRARPGGPRG